MRPPRPTSTEQHNIRLLRTLQTVSLPDRLLDCVVVQPVPAVCDLHSPQARGYLWRLSTRRMVYTHDWKRKYFVLAGERLYYHCRSVEQAFSRLD